MVYLGRTSVTTFASSTSSSKKTYKQYAQKVMHKLSQVSILEGARKKQNTHVEHDGGLPLHRIEAVRPDAVLLMVLRMAPAIS